MAALIVSLALSYLVKSNPAANGVSELDLVVLYTFWVDLLSENFKQLRVVHKVSAKSAMNVGQN